MAFRAKLGSEADGELVASVSRAVSKRAGLGRSREPPDDEKKSDAWGVAGTA